MKMSRERVLRDHYYLEAKSEGYRARSAYKLKQILQRYRLINRGAVVVDLGAAPGGWLQVAEEFAGGSGLIVGVDIAPIAPLPFDNVKTFRGDVAQGQTLHKLINLLPKGADVVLSDLAPRFSGIHHLDHHRQIELARMALNYAKHLLKEGGAAVIKALQGDLFNEFLAEVKANFRVVKVFKPRASRSRSSEVYVIGMHFKRS